MLNANNSLFLYIYSKTHYNHLCLHIKELIKHSNAVIEICKNQYVSANAGMAFSKELLQRLSEFESGIDIDTYICGKDFIS